MCVHIYIYIMYTHTLTHTHTYISVQQQIFGIIKILNNWLFALEQVDNPKWASLVEWQVCLLEHVKPLENLAHGSHRDQAPWNFGMLINGILGIIQDQFSNLFSFVVPFVCLKFQELDQIEDSCHKHYDPHDHHLPRTPITNFFSLKRKTEGNFFTTFCAGQFGS